MGHNVRGHMIVMSVVILVFLVVSGRKVDMRIRTPQQFDLRFDATFSEAARQDITAFVESLDKRWALRPVLFTSIIKERFPFIQSAQSRLVPPGTMKLICHAHKPLCIINQTLLLVPPQSLCPTSYFQEAIVASLPTIAVEPSLLKTYDPKIMVSVVSGLGADIFARYQVAVPAEGSILFEDKQQPRLSLVCRVDKVPTTTLCMYGKYMHELLESRNAFKGKSNTHFVADLRFEKQIILSKK